MVWNKLKIDYFIRRYAFEFVDELSIAELKTILGIEEVEYESSSHSESDAEGDARLEEVLAKQEYDRLNQELTDTVARQNVLVMPDDEELVLPAICPHPDKKALSFVLNLFNTCVVLLLDLASLILCVMIVLVNSFICVNNVVHFCIRAILLLVTIRH